MQNFDVVIIGAGAAGLMCALRAGQRGRKVLLLDHAEQAGSKILISGGGRCNFTNRSAAADRYISDNPHFCISALKSYTPRDFVALVEKHKIPYHEKKLGQLFCDAAAKSIVNMLLEECEAARVELRLSQEIKSISKTDSFAIQTQNEKIEAASLVLATGGLSIPKMGASDFTHRIARQFGLPLTQTRPALVPLVFEDEAFAPFRALSGLSLEVVVTCGKKSFREDMLFTHKGLSGPAILQISSYWREGQALSIDLMPEQDAYAFLTSRKAERPKAGLKTILGEALPQRLAQTLTETHFPDSQIGALTNEKLKAVAALLKAWALTPSGTEGYAKAEITLGGVATQALSSKTMECAPVPNLYIIGEAVDVTGWLGGYNLQWAWSSGWAAGSAIKE
ncbi:MAG: NAD(P)/FAD-dependent oxidoreductase [Bdellovibrionales bacterium]